MSQGRAPWTLRRRLVVGLTALVAVVLTCVGVASVTTLNSSLTAVIDSQLTASARALTLSVNKFWHGLTEDGHPTRIPPQHKPIGEFPGHSPKTVTAVVHDGIVLDSARFVDSGAIEVSDAVLDQIADLATSVELQPGDEIRTTIELGELGPYRVEVTRNDFDETLVTAVSLGTARDAVVTESIIVAILSFIALVLTVLGTILLVRLALRPLARVAKTAGDVAAEPMDSGEVTIAERVAEADTDTRTEVGRVGSALNLLLDHVEHALAVRAASDMRMRRFVTDASHELRTPLAAIHGYAELTRQESAQLPDLTEHALTRIESESRRMATLVEDLMLLARLDEGQDAHLDELDVSEIVVNAVDDARAADASHEWILDVPDEAVLVHGDHERLHQLVANLLANARVHTPSGSTVTARLTPESDTVVLDVSDNGPGIDPELVPRLFERFARGDASRSRHAGSTGLGLAIAASIVEAHNGHITVETAPTGTTFRVTLPTTTE